MKAVNSIRRMKRIISGKHWYWADMYDYYYDVEIYSWRHSKMKQHYGFKKRWVGELPF